MERFIRRRPYIETNSNNSCLIRNVHRSCGMAIRAVLVRADFSPSLSRSCALPDCRRSVWFSDSFMGGSSKFGSIPRRGWGEFMKRASNKAYLLAYLGVILLIVGFYPALPPSLTQVRFLHAIWHVWLFVGAAMFIYGLETLHRLARRHRRITN